MYQAIGIESKKIYAQGSRADCFRMLNKNYPYIASEKNTSKWSKGNNITVKAVFEEPIRIVKTDRKLMERKNS